MSLRDLNIRSYYNKADIDIAQEFYLPCMAASTKYDRATGYFGSTVYLLSWGCLKEFIDNGGKIRIICSPYLAKMDQDAIDEGLQARSSSEAYDNLFEEFKQIFSQEYLNAPERVLACLIAMGYVEIKVAVGKNDINRLFHDKVGVFYDDSDAVAFRGSINETFKGISDDGNFESFDAFTSWSGGNDLERLNGIVRDFDQIWNNQNSQIRVHDLPDSIKELVKAHATKTSNWTDALEEVKVSIDKARQWSADKKRDGRRPRKHQLEALEAWENSGRRGVFEHATGSGKTFSAMCAIRKELELGHPVLILVPSVGLLTQWHEELKSTFGDLDVRYLLCGGGNTSWKEGTMLKTFTRPDLKDRLRVTIAVMGTAASDEFLLKVAASDKLMVVADEAHRMGSPYNQRFFSVESGARLALSATPRRYGDSEGTKAILSYFGDIIPPPYTLQNAIEDNVLCKYFYHPSVVRLTEEEQRMWDEISHKISVEYARTQSSETDKPSFYSERVKQLLLKRARIVKNAQNKVQLALGVVLKHYRENDRWIVYCDNKGQMNSVLDALCAAGIRAYEYHSELPDSTRKATLAYFEEIGGVVVSIKCLDEGIDIPNTTHALILASSQNPREFIQRRGRILRKSSNKRFAYLYDAIVVPNAFSEADKVDRIVETELSRAIQFGEWSQDKTCIVDLKLIAIDNDIDYKELQKYGTENDE